MQKSGIILVKIAVKQRDFDSINNVMVSMAQGESIESLRKKYGELCWTQGRSLLTDDWIEIFISRTGYINLSEYGKPIDELWSKLRKTIDG